MLTSWESGHSMRYNGFYYALFRGTMKKVLVEHYGKSFAADTIHRTKGIYKKLVVDWYDALVIDCLWFCHSKRCIIPRTEDMTTAYHDYGFHIRGSVKGMLIGPQVCLLVGGLTALLAVIWPPSILL